MKRKFILLSPFIALTVAFSFDVALGRQSSSHFLSKLTKEAQSQPRLPSSVKALVDSAVIHYNRRERPKSIRDLHAVLAAKETKQTSSLFRALLYQWLALNHFALSNLDSASYDSASYYVERSLKVEYDIWPDQLESELPEDIRMFYQNCVDAFLNRFKQKRQSWRIAIGTITRADYSYNYGLFDVVAGIGTTVVLFEEIREILEKTVDYRTKFFNDLLLFVRLQRMRKNIERLTAGFYGEFSLSVPFKNNEISVKAVSFGPILSYASQSGWEIGGSCQVARLAIGQDQINFSQTIFNEERTRAFSLSNFELYIRKWF